MDVGTHGLQCSKSQGHHHYHHHQSCAEGENIKGFTSIAIESWQSTVHGPIAGLPTGGGMGGDISLSLSQAMRGTTL